MEETEKEQGKMEIYLDNSATTPCSASAAALVERVLTADYGNPSSLHTKGVEAERYVREASERIAKTLRCEPKEIIFTSGGTESNNLAILGAARANRRRGKHIITTAIEHPSVAKTMQFLAEAGFDVTYLPVNAYGEISTDDLSAALRDDTILVSAMMVNNEIGALEPVAEIGQLVHAKHPDILFHVDAVQSYGKFRIAPKKLGIDLLSASGHKIHGPKGVGFLYVRDKAKIRPVTFGGGQQRDLRSGTINAPGIAGMGEAAREIYETIDDTTPALFDLRAHLIDRLLSLDDVQVNGRITQWITGRETVPEEKETADAAEQKNRQDISPADPMMAVCAPHIVSATFSGVKSEVLLHVLEEKGIYVSAGSACASGHPSDSTTLPAIGLTKAQQESTLRFSMSVHTTREELDYTADALAELLPLLRRYQSY